MIKKSLRMDIDPSYYAITTAEVLYCNDLNDAEILLYTVVSGLAKKEGYCWATNDQLADLRNKSAVSISRQVKHIERLGFFKIDYDYYGKVVTERRIYPLTNVTIIKNDNGESNVKNDDRANVKNDKGAIIKNDKDNSIIIINKNINIGCVFCVLKKYPNTIGKVSSLKNIPKLIKRYNLSKVLRAIERYLEYVKSERDNGFKTLGYQNGSTFFNSGINDYLEDDYISPVKEVVERKKILKPRNITTMEDVNNNPEFKKTDIKLTDLLKDMVKKGEIDVF